MSSAVRPFTPRTALLEQMKGVREEYFEENQVSKGKIIAAAARIFWPATSLDCSAAQVTLATEVELVSERNASVNEKFQSLGNEYLERGGDVNTLREFLKEFLA